MYISKINTPPLPIDNFVGREKEFTSLIDLLKPQETVLGSSGKTALIYGEDGCGKSELTMAVTKKLSKVYPNGQILIRCNDLSAGISCLKLAFQTVIHSIDPLSRLSESPYELRDIYLSLLAEKKILIVIDHLSKIDNLKLLMPPGGSALLVNSNELIEVPEALCLKLNKLSQSDIEQLTQPISCILSTYPSLALSITFSPLIAQICIGVDSFFKRSAPWIEISENIERAINNTSGDQYSGELHKRTLHSILDIIFSKLDKKAKHFLLECSFLGSCFSRDDATWSSYPEQMDYRDVEAYLYPFCQIGIITYDKDLSLYQIHNDIHCYIQNRTNDIEYNSNKHIPYYLSLAEDCATLAGDGGYDGLLLGSLLLDDHLPGVRMAFEQLQTANLDLQSNLSQVLTHIKVLNIFGKLRFFPKSEILPQINYYQKLAIEKNDPYLMDILLKNRE